jgi:hypothetical protein
MSREITVALVLASCSHGNGGSTTVPSEMLDKHHASSTELLEPKPAPAPAPMPAMSELTPEAACARFDVLAGESCGWATRFPPAFRQTTSCVSSLQTWFAPETPEHETLHRTVDCWALDCDDAAACMVTIQSHATPPPARSCGEEGTAAILVDATAWAARRGVATKRFAEITTSEREPIEVCGIDGEVDWITRVTCNDGSNPYGSVLVANDSRDSWLARGGRCNSVLDRYSVKCPEATYQVHVDRYVCPH